MNAIEFNYSFFMVKNLYKMAKPSSIHTLWYNLSRVGALRNDHSQFSDGLNSQVPIFPIKQVTVLFYWKHSSLFFLLLSKSLVFLVSLVSLTL